MAWRGSVEKILCMTAKESPKMPPTTLILGQTLTFTRDPFLGAPEESAQHSSRGGVLVEGNRIAAVGEAEQMRREAGPDTEVVDMGESLLLPGFVDAHAHFPQSAIIASWGKRLIDWLNSYTFPEEMRFADPEYAAQSAALYLDLLQAHGTTTVCAFTTSHPQSAEALFAEAARRGMRLAAGKTCMDRNAPEPLCDTPKRAYDESEALLSRWHQQKGGRLSYVITPRFSITSTPEQLEALGALWARYPNCLMQTHLSEQPDEIALVRKLHPEARDYLDTYEAHGLIGPNALYGHAIHLEPRERDRLREQGAALVHCPTSNTFLGSGLFDLHGLRAEGQRIALATDTGGGSSFSMLRSQAAAYEISQLNRAPLHPAQMLWLATQGSANALGMGHAIGALAKGREADIIALDLASTPAIAQRSARAETIWEALFPTQMMGDDRAIRALWINGIPTN